MDNSFGKNGVENLFDGLSEDNKTLLRDLNSFNKCLNALNRFKSFVDLISHKIRPNLDSNELKTFEELNKEVEDVFSNENVRKSVWNSTTDSFNEFQVLSEVKKEIFEIPEESDVQRTHELQKNVSEEVAKARDPNYHPKGFLCDICEKVLKTENSLMVHKKTVHELDPKFLFCDFKFCKYKTISEYQLSKHKNRHKPHESLKCSFNVCGQEFKSEDILNEHIKEEHNIKKFHFKCCYGCDKRFPIEDNLRYHVEVQHKTSYKPFKCKVPNCYKIFRFEGKLRYHNKIWHERRYGCPHPECDFIGTNKKHLDSHLENHSKFKCGAEGCGQAFVLKHHLTSHQKTAHPSEDIFFCEWEGCHKSFKTECGLKTHSIKHTDTVFTCEWPGCGFTTKMKNCLRNHKVIHSSEFAFGCDWPECGKRFKLKTRLDNHLRIHNNDKRYGCHWPGCQYRCTDSGNLSKHEKQVHKRKMRTE